MGKLFSHLPANKLACPPHQSSSVPVASSLSSCQCCSTNDKLICSSRPCRVPLVTLSRSSSRSPTTFPDTQSLSVQNPSNHAQHVVLTFSHHRQRAQCARLSLLPPCVLIRASFIHPDPTTDHEFQCNQHTLYPMDRQRRARNGCASTT